MTRMLLFLMSVHIVGAILPWRETMVAVITLLTGRYEPPRHHSPENEGEDHKVIPLTIYNRDGHRNSYLAAHYARDEYRRGYSTVLHSVDGYRRSQSTARDRSSFQSPSSTDKNGHLTHHSRRRSCTCYGKWTLGWEMWSQG